MSLKNNLFSLSKTQNLNSNIITHMNSSNVSDVKLDSNKGNNYDLNFGCNHRNTLGAYSSDVSKKKQVKFKDKIDKVEIESYKKYNLLELNVYDSVDVGDKCNWQCQCILM